MRDKHVIVTGATRGIGRETALALSRMGAGLSLVVRDGARGDEIAREVRAARQGQGQSGGDVDVFVGDLSSIADVRRIGAEILAKHPKIDVLVNNAGAILTNRQVTKEGLEATFATNHLSYFLLTSLLLDALKAAPAARIVNVASEAHRGGTIRFDDLMGERSYSGLGAYNASKLANILFTRELARRLEGTSVTTNVLHPGVVASGFALNNRGLIALFYKVAAPLLTSSEKGARCSIFLASSDAVAESSGKYYVRCKVKTPSREARDDGVAKRLWSVSEELVAARG